MDVNYGDRSDNETTEAGGSLALVSFSLYLNLRQIELSDSREITRAESAKRSAKLNVDNPRLIGSIKGIQTNIDDSIAST